MALANVAERRELASVWDELFTAEVNEIYLEPARADAREGEALSFWGLSARGRTRGEVVLGWKAKGSVEPVLNPRDRRRAPPSPMPIGSS